jgi:cytochrome c oxidase cbb3-type subunit 3
MVCRWSARRILLAAMALGGLACEREKREQPIAAAVGRPPVAMQTEISPGKALEPVAAMNPYQGNAYAMNEGKRLYSWFNCVGCHAHGGGGMGPPLMDARWIYGAQPENIHSTIVEGRPNGMPSFQGKIPDHQVWQLVAYVRSMAGLAPKDAAPGRNDQMHVGRPENLTTPEGPIREPVVHE